MINRYHGEQIFYIMFFKESIEKIRDEHFKEWEYLNLEKSEIPGLEDQGKLMIYLKKTYEENKSLMTEEERREVEEMIKSSENLFGVNPKLFLENVKKSYRKCIKYSLDKPLF